MKKNITINLFGALYNIDEDAYRLLDSYQENMRRYFTRLEGGEEIADDVEHRVAELFAELKAEGVEAITIEHVQDIIHRIGNPEEMGDSNDEAAADSTGDTTEQDGNTADGTCPPPPPQGHQPKEGKRALRRFFRDPEDKMLGGVMSGLCKYFGFSDPLPWRLIFLLLCFFTYSGLFWLYLILWAIMPEALTPEDRLMMQGKPVNPETLNEELMRGVKNTKSFVQDPTTRNKARGCLSGLLGITVGIFKIGLIGLLMFFGLIGICLLIVFCGIGFIGIKPAMGGGGPFDGELAQYMALYPDVRYWLTGASIFAVIAVAIPLYALLRSIVRQHRGEKSGSFATPVGIIAWLLAIGAAGGTGAVGASYLQKAHDEISKKRNTHNGIYLTDYSWRQLGKQGWNLAMAKNCASHISTSTADPRVWPKENSYDLKTISIKADDDDRPLEFRLERFAAVEPGVYRIEALYRLDRERQTGWYMKLPGDSITTQRGSCTALLPGNRFSDYSWNDARNRSVLTAGADSANWAGAQVNAIKEDWYYFTKDVTVTKAGTLEYGFYQDSELNHEGATTTEFEVADARITRLDAPARP